LENQQLVDIKIFVIYLKELMDLCIKLKIQQLIK